MTASQPASSNLPFFSKQGLLPAGDYPLTIEELHRSHLVTGEGNPSTHWDKDWRLYLVDNLEIMAMQLRSLPRVGRLFIDGSFVENKDHPNDIDGYFEVDIRYFASRQLHRDLNDLDPFHCWTWDVNSRILDPNSAKRQLPMWHRYRVELYPHYEGATTGIPDEFGHDQPFPAAFRKSRTQHRPKGIIEII